MTLDLLLFLIGLGLLLLGAEWLVTGATRLAAIWGVSPLVVGLTVVAFGTSAPEMVVSVVAAARDQGGLALGNVVGSNIANVALILGIAALIRPMPVGRDVMARDVPVTIAVSILVAILGWNGLIGRWEAGILLAVFAWYMLHLSRIGGPPEAGDEVRTEKARRGTTLIRILLGTVGLALGAHLMVESATVIARSVGISETVIGITLVAFGTSVPELAASAVAAVRGRADMILGNVIGSNVFNATLILGVAALVRPLPVEAALYGLELPVMVGAAILLLPLMYTRLTLQRWEGALLFLGYIGFIWMVLR